MPKVTNVKGQKNKNRVNVYIDESFSFGIDREIWIQKKYKIGDELKDEDISLIKQEDDRSVVFDKLLHFLSFRPRSKKEVLTKLNDLVKRYEVSESNQEKIIDKLKKYGYVNDEEFGIWWIGQRKKRLKGKKLVRQELYEKGLDQKLIDKLLAEETVAGKEEARMVIDKNKWRFRGESFKIKKKMQEMLLRRGFTWEEVNSVVTEFLDEKDINR